MIIFSCIHDACFLRNYTLISAHGRPVPNIKPPLVDPSNAIIIAQNECIVLIPNINPRNHLLISVVLCRPFDNAICLFVGRRGRRCLWLGCNQPFRSVYDGIFHQETSEWGDEEEGEILYVVVQCSDFAECYEVVQCYYPRSSLLRYCCCWYFFFFFCVFSSPTTTTEGCGR